jgi:hypothetical protein
MQSKEQFTQKEFDNITNQAKEMEMIQITEAFDDGAENHYDADLYFNKKFKPGYKNEN